MPTYSHESLIPLMINERLLSSRAVDARLYNTRVNSCFLERVLPDRVECSIAAQGLVMSDLNLMVIGGGRERTAAEHRALLEAAGFALTKVVPTQSEVSVIEAVPA